MDPSALVALMLDERPAAEIAQVLQHAAGPIMSAASVVELLLVLEARLGPSGSVAGRQLLDEANLVTVPVDDVITGASIDAWRRFGKGRHRAGLNFGDCFSYALAKHWGLPLLCVGDDFGHTDLTLALP